MICDYISSLYPSAKDRASKVNDSVGRAVSARYFTETDGKKMKADLAKDGLARNSAK